MNKHNILEVASRIKELREFSDMTYEEVAKIANITTSEYIEYENGTKDIPIGKFYNIANAFKIDPTMLLTGDISRKKDFTIIYKGQGTPIERYPGYKFTSLAYDFVERIMEPMIVELESGIEPKPVTHSGQEFNYVIEGNVRVMLDNKEYYLRPGDSIYFDSQIPHAQSAMNGSAKFLTVISEKSK